MNLQVVTLTGADDTTNVDDLIRLSRRYPFVEWGILGSESHRGAGRYPSLDWTVNFMKKVQGTDVKRAYHVCGRMVGDFIAISELTEYFPRIQINFDAEELPMCLSTGKDVTPADFVRLMDECKHASFIMQYTEVNADFISQITSPNCTVLFDESAGAGISPEYWPNVLPNRVCGYAGGMGPDNVIEEIHAVEQVCNQPYWIDMETKVRTDVDPEFTDGKFCLQRCEAVLAAVDDIGLKSTAYP